MDTLQIALRGSSQPRCEAELAENIALQFLFPGNQLYHFRSIILPFTLTPRYGAEDLTKMGWVNLRAVNFLSLQTAVFCVQCELISQNNTSGCLSCGSQALLSLARVLGGSLRNQQTAHLIVDSELDRLVRELIGTVPQPELTNEPEPTSSFPSRVSGRHHVRSRGSESAERDVFSDREIHQAEVDFQPAIHVIAERAQSLTRATGAAVALRKGSEIVCRARTGRTAPDLGVRLQTDSGISAECVRTGEVVLCHDAQRNPQVDLASCHRLGVRSILVAPLRHFRRTLGIFEVLSSAPHAFGERDVATMQLLASMIVAAISRLSDSRLNARCCSV